MEMRKYQVYGRKALSRQYLWAAMVVAREHLLRDRAESGDWRCGCRICTAVRESMAQGRANSAGGGQ